MLTWTDRTPTEPGDYFFRHGPGFVKHFYEVCNLANLTGLYALSPSFKSNLVSHMDGQWAGPIPDPQEPTEAKPCE